MTDLKNTPNKKTCSLFNRREFLKITGSGIFVFFMAGKIELFGQGAGFGPGYPEDFNAYLKIGEDGRVSCFTGKIEMGQGIITSMAQILAEELDISLYSVDMVMGDTLLCPWDFATVGSNSTKVFGPSLRKAGAEARLILIQLAAEKLNVDAERLYTENGFVRDSKNKDEKIPYGELTKGKQIEWHIKDREVTTKEPSTYTVSGKSTYRTDSLEKVTGRAIYAGDIPLSGMLHARILRPPAHNSRLKNVDVSGAKKIRGAIIIEEKDLTAALHEIPEQAERALSLIKAEYETPEPDLDNRNIFDHLEKNAPRGQVSTQKGNVDNGRKQADLYFESRFLSHYVAHAPMETHTSTAVFEDGGVKIWASTQAPFMVQMMVAGALGLPNEKVRVLPVHVGGGFGGKISNQDSVEAARLARLTERPVQVAMTRKEEFFYDSFRPAAVVRAASGLDGKGKITYWDFEILFAGTRSSEPIYDIPNQRVMGMGTGLGQDRAHPFNTGAWRGPGSNTNVFAMESQVDIMAQAAGIDPLTFRLNNLKNNRMRVVLKAAADKFGHPFSKGPSGNGYGIACTDYLGTYVAAIAHIKADKKTGNVRIEKIVCAQDMGEIINPQGAVMQIEGGITMGISSALTEEVEFRGGTVLTENFHTYEITNFSTAPKIEAVLVENPDMPPQGCGEPACTTVAAVLANAIYDALGVRLYELPMTPDRIRSAV